MNDALDAVGAMVDQSGAGDLRGATALTLVAARWCWAGRSPPAIATGSTTR